MFGISGTELFFIVAFVLIIFGPDKLPGFARTIGRFMREFKKTQELMESQIRAEMLGGDKGDGTTTDRMKKAANAGRAAVEQDDDYEDEEEEEEEE
ncbi:MAG: twin-arginine translocase TatA/TatE family subunit [Actinomycetota bacterium]|nr:twin-arginine translocase TatA/TatE family subunit [Actinomycetota bacterium]